MNDGVWCGSSESTFEVGSGAGYSVQGDISGAVVIGNQSLAVNAKEGSTVTILSAGQVPKPVRRDRIESRPRPLGKPIIGRADIIGNLDSALWSGRTVQLYGPSGIGKSVILRHAARVLRGGADGVVFVSAGSPEIRDVAQQLFEECYEAASYAPTVAELRHLMRGIRITVYVDNADFTGEQLSQLMDMVPDANFVFASREPTLRGQGTVAEVRGLRVDDGIELLERESSLSIARPSRAAASDLWAKTQGRPRLLLQVASLIRPGASGATIIPEVAEVKEIIELLLDSLPGAGRDILRLFATLDGSEIDASHVGELIGIADPASACDLLVSAGLLTADAEFYRCPPEVLGVFKEKYPESFPAGRLCRYFATWASRDETTPEQMARHASAIARAARLAEETGQPELAIEAAHAAVPGTERALRFGPWGLVLGRGWSAAKAAGDDRAEAYFIREAGIRSTLMSQVIGSVLLEAAIGKFQRLGMAPNGSLHAARAQSGPVYGTGLARGAAARHMAKLADSPGWPQFVLPPDLPVVVPPPDVLPEPPGTPRSGRNGGGNQSPRQTSPGSTKQSAQQLRPKSPPAPKKPSQPGPSKSPTSSAGGAVTTGGAGVMKLVAAAIVVAVGIAIWHANSNSSDLAGTWQDSQKTFTISDAGDGTYSYEGISDGCSYTVTLTGSGDTYSGQVPLFADGCTSIGDASVTYTLESGGQQLDEQFSSTSATDSNGDTVTCTSCVDSTYSRESS